ncbi:MAG: protein translocase subunit SecD [Lentisphaeria bacterium]|nr:protein translocase subunit SecD [Lentisphaeria bacterium]
MKKSLYWRWALIVVVMFGWAISIFPYKDRPFLEMFEKVASGQLENYEKDAAENAARVGELRKKLDALGESQGEERAILEEEYEEARAPQVKVERFAELTERAQKVMTDAVEKSGGKKTLPLSMAFLQAAKDDVGWQGVRLRDYIDVPTIAKPSNKVVLSYVSGKARGKLHLGLDLQGGTEFVIGFDADDPLLEGRTPEQVRDQIMVILRNRVDMLGVAEAEIKEAGSTSISLRMPTVSENEKASIREMIKKSARLEFFLVDPASAAKVAEYQKGAKNFQPSDGFQSRPHVMESEKDGEVLYQRVFLKIVPEDLPGDQVKRARPTFDQYGNYAINLQFKALGAKAFAKITKANVGQRLAIVMDGTVYSAPSIKSAIVQGSAEITGNFTAQEASKLAGVIESGNLPVDISIDSEFGTDPTLGRSSIRDGVWAAVAGLTMVMVFMIVYYGLAGWAAIAALVCNLVLVVGTMALFRATITLPGIAGLVLTIGMAVDANVLIFERIREELRTGKTLGNAIKAGYGRAFVTILDSNLTTLLTAYILFKCGSGPVRGFAVILSIGIIASMFTALFMTRCLFDTGIFLGYLKKMFGMFPNGFCKDPSVDFLGKSKMTMLVSGTLIVASLVVFGTRRGGALAIDFRGGTEIAYSYTGDRPPVEEVQKLLTKEGYSHARVIYKNSVAQSTRLLEVTLPERSTDEAALDLQKLYDNLVQAYPKCQLVQAQTNSVGGLVGKQFKYDALLAALLATFGIVIYISFRFEFAYGVAAVAALAHDVIIAAGLYLIWPDRTLSLPVVAALLTIMGYSLNDTIVVFDRIREDLELYRDRSYIQIINMSINQTLSRTVLTSTTTFIVVFTLWVFGGGAINDFAYVMLVGVIIGTYSSIFVASAIVAHWHKRSWHHAESEEELSPGTRAKVKDAAEITA